jgi:hypothetical protein
LVLGQLEVVEIVFAIWRKREHGGLKKSRARAAFRRICDGDFDPMLLHEIENTGERVG